MCAAAIGNIVSDVAGILLGTLIEDFCTLRLGLRQPPLTDLQRNLRSVRWSQQLGCGIGIVIGCIIGMIPLYFIDSTKIQKRKRQYVLDNLFQDVVEEAGQLVGAESIVLFLLVDAPKQDKTNKKAAATPTTVIPTPTANGTYLYAR